MKRILISAVAIAALIAGCGSGGSTTPVASKKTTKKTTTTKKHTTHKSSPSSGGGAVTTTTTTSASPPPTTTTSAPPPPPTTTHTVAPTTTHQTTTHHHHHHHGGPPQGYCLSVTTRIATPTGSVPVAQIKPGMLVWSSDLSGRRISVKVLKVRRAHVPADHLMARLRLADGRNLSVSLTHPLPDGAAVSTLADGQRFEGSRVASAARVRYGRPYTYDLLPAGPTDTYFADGVLMGSTLAPSRAFPLTHLF